MPRFESIHKKTSVTPIQLTVREMFRFRLRNYFRFIAHGGIVLGLISITLAGFLGFFWLNRMSDNQSALGRQNGDSAFPLHDLENNRNKQLDIQWKTILFWNEAYAGNKTFDIGIGEDMFLKAKCPVWQCKTTSDRNILPIENYDAVVFNQRKWTPMDLPINRSRHQHYIFWSRESPGWRYVNTNTMAEFFNWTMTYRWDSDIVYPYGRITLTNPIIGTKLSDTHEFEQYIAETKFDPSISYAAGKTKMVSWFVSNCKSLSARNEYVDRLKNFIDVDIYGDCGNMSCSRSNPELCRQMLERDYKFYLSLENTLCEDYVTEKFFDSMRYHIIPIVFDLHGHHARMAPPHSYINAADYQSVRELADYLILLDGNDTLYNEYFWWKKHYVVYDNDNGIKRSMCELCRMLHVPNKSGKTYSDMTSWWDIQATCQTITFSDETQFAEESDGEDVWEAKSMLVRWFG